jgi:hypothetical protein
MIFNTKALGPDFVLIQDNTFHRNTKGKYWKVKPGDMKMIYLGTLTP